MYVAQPRLTLSLHRVPVTQLDIDRAVPFDWERSPFHQALTRFGFAARVTAGYIEVRSERLHWARTLPLGLELSAWLRDFDGGRAVAPTVLFLMLPDRPQ